MASKRPREDFESGSAPDLRRAAPSAVDPDVDPWCARMHALLGAQAESHRRLCELRRRVELEPPLAGQAPTAPTAACV